MNAVPRCEYPRPLLVRENWLCLNGEWEFEIDNAISGLERDFPHRSALNGKITVPFAPESPLSGVGNTDFMNCVWYRRTVTLPENFAGKRVLLHFGAVDYHARVFVNGKQVMEHKGGYTPFCGDVTDALTAGENVITVMAVDDIRGRKQPFGKQSVRYASYGCHYTRTTGIWQTVWMEAVDECHVSALRTYPDVSTASVSLQMKLSGDFRGAAIEAVALYEGKEMGRMTVSDVTSATPQLTLSLAERHLWEVGKGRLYDLVLTLSRNGEVLDRVESYFGLRSVSLCGRAFLLNGKPVFGRWVLDQGFYPDGIYTAPTDEALKNDILYAMELGFNGARLHEKVFEPRFLYWADKLGYLCWGEHANWGLDITEAGSVHDFLPEWMEAVERDFNHPSIIGWCPFNETWDFKERKQCDDVVLTVYKATKAIDPTRPVIDTSGNFHVVTDIFDVHDYTQDCDTFRQNYARIEEGIVGDTLSRRPHLSKRQCYDGKAPFFVSEYGGISWNAGEDSWGYGSNPQSEEEFLSRYRGLTEALMENPLMLGFCYTQLYDVEQERNGLMTYDRVFKFDPALIRAVNSRPAAIEK